MKINGCNQCKASFSAKPASAEEIRRIVETGIGNYNRSLGLKSSASTKEVVEAIIEQNKKTQAANATTAKRIFARMYESLKLGPNPSPKEFALAIIERAKNQTLNSKKSI